MLAAATLRWLETAAQHPMQIASGLRYIANALPPASAAKAATIGANIAGSLRAGAADLAARQAAEGAALLPAFDTTARDNGFAGLDAWLAAQYRLPDADRFPGFQGLLPPDAAAPPRERPADGGPNGAPPGKQPVSPLAPPPGGATSPLIVVAAAAAAFAAARYL